MARNARTGRREAVPSGMTWSRRKTRDDGGKNSLRPKVGSGLQRDRTPDEPDCLCVLVMARNALTGRTMAVGVRHYDRTKALRAFSGIEHRTSQSDAPSAAERPSSPAAGLHSFPCPHPPRRPAVGCSAMLGRPQYCCRCSAGLLRLAVKERPDEPCKTATLMGDPRMGLTPLFHEVGGVAFRVP